VGIADDMTKGLIDRFRSLPMARSAFLTGRTVSDVVYNLGHPHRAHAVGLVVGWRVRDGLGRLSAPVWLWHCCRVRDVLGGRAARHAGAQCGGRAAGRVYDDLPVDVLSNAFVPTETSANVLQPIAEWNPVSVLTASMRDSVGQPQPVRAQHVTR
jgi:hypothetical protein